VDVRFSSWRVQMTMLQFVLDRIVYIAMCLATSCALAALLVAVRSIQKGIEDMEIVTLVAIVAVAEALAQVWPSGVKAGQHQRCSSFLILGINRLLMI